MPRLSVFAPSTISYSLLQPVPVIVPPTVALPTRVIFEFPFITEGQLAPSPQPPPYTLLLITAFEPITIFVEPSTTAGMAPWEIPQPPAVIEETVAFWTLMFTSPPIVVPDAAPYTEVTEPPLILRFTLPSTSLYIAPEATIISILPLFTVSSTAPTLLVPMGTVLPKTVC